VLILPLRPIQSVTAVTLHDDDATSRSLDIDNFVVDGFANPARLVWRGQGAVPAAGMIANGIEIDFVAGHADAAADVPQPIRQALLLLIAHWYENREPVEIGASATTIPAGVSELLMPYRRRQL
jgi:uncharacterized phiE125 gp8 family phage protein